MNILRKLQAYLAFKSVCSEADALFRKDGVRRFVIPFNDGTIEVLTASEALALKTEGHLAKDLTAKTLYGACYYFSATNNHNAKVKCAMPDREVKRRRQVYYRWFERHHK